MDKRSLLYGGLIGLFLGLTIGLGLASGSTRATTYTNLEEWEIIKDSRGRVIGVRAHREAKSS